MIYSSRAPVNDGAFGNGASISRISPASRTALAVVGPNATIFLFIYFTVRGDSEDFFEVFLSFVIMASIAWIGVAFFKLSGRSEHSLFHLFSYICATEIIPLLITVKVLFQ